MKKLMEKFERVYSAVAFAEAGEFETAKEIMREEKQEHKRDTASPKREQLRAPGIKR